VMGPLGASIPVNVAIGAVVGAALAAGSTFVFPLPPLWICVAAGAFIGGNVGLYLAYFHQDDRKIEAAGRDYGRDAHWLDPFAYGAAAYLLAFLPASVALGVSAFAVGAMVGVVAAATSHFILGMA